MIDFLVDVVGFRRTAVYTEGDARRPTPSSTGPRAAASCSAAAARRSGVAPGIASIYVVTDHVDAVHARVQDAPGRHDHPAAEDTDYGNHEFVMTDPEGNFWSFGTYRGEPSCLHLVPANPRDSTPAPGNADSRPPARQRGSGGSQRFLAGGGRGSGKCETAERSEV